MLSSISLEFGPLVPARFVERPNRFVVHCRLESSGELVAAHLADPGRLKELLVPGARLYLRQAAEPTRKTRWSVILVQAASSVLVSLQSALVNHLAAEALRRGPSPSSPSGMCCAASIPRAAPASTFSWKTMGEKSCFWK